MVTARELWTMLHGMGLGLLFLLSFAAGIAGLYSLRPAPADPAAVNAAIRRLIAGSLLMAVAAWLAVISGTWIIYPWYRAIPVHGVDLANYPRSYLLSSEATAAWHSFVMESKEQVGWIAPILATAVAFVAWRYRSQIADDPKLWRALTITFILAFTAANVAGLFGLFVTRAAPLM